jgi:hypothetical protein
MRAGDIMYECPKCRFSENAKDKEVSEREKQEQVIAQYGDTKVKFLSYYKYMFCFGSQDTMLLLFVGGDRDDIYKFSVAASKEYLAGELIKDLPCSVSYKGEEVYNDR